MLTRFKLKENDTNVRREILAGLTTFSTVAYIIFVNPSVLSKTGMDFNAVMVATCLAAAIGTLLIGLLSNYPFAQAPGMGLNAFFTYTVVFQLGYSWQQALGIVFISGIVFILLTLSGVRAKILDAFPSCILHAIPAGIGLFITLIGLNSAGIIDMNQGPIIDILIANNQSAPSDLIGQINNAPPQVLQFGDFHDPQIFMAIVGFIIMAILVVLNVPAAILIGILLCSILGFVLGFTQWPAEGFQAPDISATFLQLNFSFFGDKMSIGQVFNFLTILIAFTMVDLFDTLGTLYGTADKGGFLDKNGKLPRINRALLSDAIATTSGALLGTSTTTTYIESATGIAAGGRTGLVSITVASCFVLCIFISPLAYLIPNFATAPALIMVGVFMFASVKKIEFTKLEYGLPAFLTIVVMPFAYGIADGIGFGIISFCILAAVKKHWDDLNVWILGIAFLFIIKYVFIA